MSFEVAPEAYDGYMGRWSRRLAAPFADFAGITPGMRVLDVGCGTGALTEDLLRRDPGHVCAVDPSAPFVDSVRTRLPDVDVRLAAAEQLPFDDGSFDAALALLVVHFMADPVAGLAEMARVTRAGGVVAAGVWDFGGGRGPLGIFWEAARAVVPGAPGEAHLPGTRAGHLQGIFRAAGLRDVASTALVVAIEHPTFDDWWEPFTRGAGPAGSFVAGLAPGDRERLVAECRRRLPRGPITVTAAAWTVRGTA